MNWLPEVDPAAVFRVVDVTGVVANGLLGGAIARAKRFDVIGFVLIAIVSALGGGLLRDVMLDSGPPVALTDPAYLGGAVIAAAVAYVVGAEGRWSRRTVVVLDALSLGCWSATGAAKALSVGLGWGAAIFLGVVTAVGGGMLRDVLVNDVPRIFGGSPLYATFSIVGSTELVIGSWLGSVNAGMAASILTCGVLAVVARQRNWRLPTAHPRPPLRRARDDI